MAFIHGKSAAIVLDAFDLSAYFNDVSWSQEISADETTPFGSSDKTFIVGIGEGKVSAGGVLDNTAISGAEVRLTTTLKAVTNPLLLTLPAGNTIGYRAFMGAGVETTFEVSEKVTDVVETKAEFQVTDGVDRGIILAAAKSVATATTTNEASQDNAASTANGGVAQLHVTANATSGTTIVKVQHSANNSTWADLVTFSTVATTVKSSERVEVAAATTVNRYLRATSTTSGTGAVVYTVAFARR